MLLRVLETLFIMEQELQYVNWCSRRLPIGIIFLSNEVGNSFMLIAFVELKSSSVTLCWLTVNF